MRKEVINTFSDGLISDLNPINTPATALSDCLNGTLITYDGNEFSLQNDKGNKKLKYSQLPNNYVPVGTAEYGDILYIVAYNPLNNKVQIGSFPSPQTIWDNSENTTEYIDSILTQENSCNNCLFTDEEFQISEQIQHSYNQLLDKHCKLKIFYDGDEGRLKIYPGDLYQIGETETTIWSNLEKLKYYILDDNKVLHDITSEVELRSSPVIDSGSNEEYYYVSWQVPGFLAYKWDLPEIQNFELRPKTIVVSKDDESENNKIATVYVNTQIESSDKMMENLFTENKIISQVNSIDLISDDRDIYNKQIFYNSSNKDDNAIIVNDNGEDRVRLTAVPKLHWKDNHYITYDQFKTVKEFSLKDLFSEDSTEFGSYTYLVKNNVDKTCTVTVKQDLQISIVAQGEILMTAFCVPLLDFINNNYNLDGLEWKECGHNLYEGQGRNNIYELEFPHEEDIYIIKYHLTDQANVENSGFDKYCLIIASEIMNDFDGKILDYRNITFNQWFPKVGSLILNPNFEIGPLIEYGKQGGSSDCDLNYWTAAFDDTHSLFANENSPSLSKIDTFVRGSSYKYDYVTAKLPTPKTHLYNFFTFENSYTGGFVGDNYSQKPLIFDNEIATITEQNYEGLVGVKIKFSPILGNLVNVPLGYETSSSKTLSTLYREKTGNNNNIWDHPLTIDIVKDCSVNTNNGSTYIAWNVIDYKYYSDSIDNTTDFGLTSDAKYWWDSSLQPYLNNVDDAFTEYMSAADNQKDTKLRALGTKVSIYLSELYDKLYGNNCPFINTSYQIHNNTNNNSIEDIPGDLIDFVYQYMKDTNLPCIPCVIGVHNNWDPSIAIDGNYTFCGNENESLVVKSKAVGNNEYHNLYKWGILFRGIGNKLFFIPIYNTLSSEDIITIPVAESTAILECIYFENIWNVYKDFFDNVKYDGTYIDMSQKETGYFLKKRAEDIEKLNGVEASLKIKYETNNIQVGNSNFNETMNNRISQEISEILPEFVKYFGGSILFPSGETVCSYSLDNSIEIIDDVTVWPYRGIGTDLDNSGIEDLQNLNDKIVNQSNLQYNNLVNEIANISDNVNGNIGLKIPDNSTSSFKSFMTTVITNDQFISDVEPYDFSINLDGNKFYKVYGITSDRKSINSLKNYTKTALFYVYGTSNAIKSVLNNES